MRMAFGLLALAIALAVVGWNMRQSLRVALPRVASPASAAIAGGPLAPRQQVQSFGQQLNKVLDAGAAARASGVER